MRALVAVLILAAVAVAAPVPKGVKAKPSADGIWELVEFDGDNGKVPPPPQQPSYRRIVGERMSTGNSSIKQLLSEEPEFTLRVRDPDRPHLRTLQTAWSTEHSAVMELDGDTLRWAYARDPAQTITECKPSGGVYYYVFKRVTVEK